MEQLVGFEPTKVSPRFERWESNPSLASSSPAAFAISATTVGASGGNRTPIRGLEGRYISRYTTPAYWQPLWGLNPDNLLQRDITVLETGVLPLD